MAHRALPLLSILALGLSLGCLYAIPDGADGALSFLLAMGGATLAYLALAACILRGGWSPRAWQILALSLLLHALLIPTGPHLDDDLYRYTWDGKVVLAGENPYLHPPNSLDLIELWRKDQYRIPYDHVPTIYPPGTQWVFAAVTAIQPDSFAGMKLAFSAINLGVLGLLIILLRQLGLPEGRALLYGANPLVLKEVANSGHMDPWLMLWLLASLLLLLRGRRLGATLALALAILAKWVPILLLPLYARRLRGWAWPFVLLGAILLAYLPFMGAGVALLSGLGTYGDYWIFNPGPFALVEGAVGWLAPAGGMWTPRLSRALAAGLVGMGALSLAWRLPREGAPAQVTRSAGLSLGLLLALSPTVDPWYLLWIAPFVALHPSAPGLAFTLLPLLSYAHYLDDADPWRLRAVEYGALAALCLVWLRRHGIRSLTEAP